MMNSFAMGRYVVPVAAAGLLAACSAMTPFTKIDGSTPSALSRMEGSWTVINTGGTKLEGMQPPAVIVFDTSAGTVTGFDGCNEFKGPYTFERGLLKARVASTRRACSSDQARAVSQRIADLFRNGAEVVDTSFMGAHVLMLKNAAGDVRMGPTAVVEKK